MKLSRKILFTSALLLAASLGVHAQDARAPKQPIVTEGTRLTGTGANERASEDRGEHGGGSKALAATSVDPTITDSELAIADPLVRVLVTKGVLSAAEARSVSTGSTVTERRDRLVALLRDKGILTLAEFEEVRAADSIKTTPTGDSTQVATGSGTLNQQQQTPPDAPQSGQGQPGAQRPESAANAPRPAAPNVIAAVTPLRPLQFEAAEREGLIPDIRLATGARIKLFGFFKTSVVHDSSSPLGNDFPLPGFIAPDTGPDRAPEFHLKARSFRFGANFEWLDPSPKTSITARLEFDFEGDFTRSASRNANAVRSSQPSIRLAWARIDRVFNESTTAFVLFGQDWTPFASSTLPNLIETTGYGLGYGFLYNRAPQVRGGFNFNIGGKRALRLQPEFAVVFPIFGNVPANIADQLAFGERQGADSQRPELQGRFVTQFKLDNAPGVVPAQLIVSFMQGERRAIVRAADVPLIANVSDTAANLFRASFPRGAAVESSRYGYTVEAQLPTRALTFVAKYYNGEDLRAFGGTQLLSNFNDTAGLTSITLAPSVDGSSNVAFGLRDGVATVAPQRPVRGQGGFVQLGFPLSRIFDAAPQGRYSGFTAYLHYSYDQVTARDARRFGGRAKSDLFAANLQYRLNSFVTFAYEQSLYRTRAANSTGALPLFRGIPSRETHNLRSELATIFTF